MKSQTNTRTPAAIRMEKPERDTLTRFAQVCGINYAEALVFRDDFQLVGLTLPMLSKTPSQPL